MLNLLVEFNGFLLWQLKWHIFLCQNDNHDFLFEHIDLAGHYQCKQWKMNCFDSIVLHLKIHKINNHFNFEFKSLHWILNDLCWSIKTFSCLSAINWNNALSFRVIMSDAKTAQSVVEFCLPNFVTIPTKVFPWIDDIFVVWYWLFWPFELENSDWRLK